MWLRSLNLGPLSVRWQNIHYNRSHVIDYYWRDKYLFTSARWYVSFKRNGKYLILFFGRKMPTLLGIMWDGRMVN